MIQYYDIILIVSQNQTMRVSNCIFDVMETIHTIYTGNLRTEVKHVRSGVSTFMDAPTDNQGKGESFSPSDMLAASLGSCMATIMGIAGRTHEISIDGMEVRITKFMASDPRRVSGVKVEFDMPALNYSEKDRKILFNAAKTCPVALSLHPDINQEIIFNYKD